MREVQKGANLTRVLKNKNKNKRSRSQIRWLIGQQWVGSGLGRVTCVGSMET